MSLDNYEILKELGRGGMGAVFLANDRRLKRQVAIKVLQMPQGIDLASAKNAINNFKREAVAIANLSHNNIVNIYDIGEQGNVHYIVMELIDGQPLSKI
ncbi:MAG: protein kinase domain-containing protein, partial [Candidatus Sericytochromatia bacterium]